MAIVRHRKNRRGFTLIELVIVIAVIAILAALLVPTILGQTERARVARGKGDVSELAKAFSRMRNDIAFTVPDDAAGEACYTFTNLRSPTAPAANVCGTTADLVPCDPNNPSQPRCWGGPYISADIGADPWGTAMNKDFVFTNKSIRVWSSGPDRANASAAACAGDEATLGLCVTQ